ncbi:hypothetical protein V502_00583 [Pseudogymnoascus sp. VKM F-4520 (FW-2644)]|nr:hypothetical protein V502_00583 [Pseudogymnoascus sp. VKM F-4520 (FW-2644)]
MQCKRILIELVNNSNEGDEDILRGEKKHKRKNLPDQPPTFVIFRAPPHIAIAQRANHENGSKTERKEEIPQIAMMRGGRRMGDAHRWTEMHGVAAQERDYVAVAMRILDATDGNEVDVWLEELKRSGCMRGIGA